MRGLVLYQNRACITKLKIIFVLFLRIVWRKTYYPLLSFRSKILVSHQYLSLEKIKQPLSILIYQKLSLCLHFTRYYIFQGVFQFSLRNYYKYYFDEKLLTALNGNLFSIKINMSLHIFRCLRLVF